MLLYALKSAKRSLEGSIIGQGACFFINSLIVIICGAKMGLLYTFDSSAIRYFEARSEGKTITKCSFNQLFVLISLAKKLVNFIRYDLVKKGM